MIVKDGIIVERLLYCQNCQTWTKHVWNGKTYSCGCGKTVIYLWTGRAGGRTGK